MSRRLPRSGSKPRLRARIFLRRASSGKAEAGDASRIASDESYWTGHVRLSLSAHPAPRKNGSSKKQEEPGTEEEILEMAGTFQPFRRTCPGKVDPSGTGQRMRPLFLHPLRTKVYPSRVQSGRFAKIVQRVTPGKIYEIAHCNRQLISYDILCLFLDVIDRAGVGDAGFTFHHLLQRYAVS
jgi:hypothetical protein